jgi:hypothetical protein
MVSYVSPAWGNGDRHGMMPENCLAATVTRCQETMLSAPS